MPKPRPDMSFYVPPARRDKMKSKNNEKLEQRKQTNDSLNEPKVNNNYNVFHSEKNAPNELITDSYKNKSETKKSGSMERFSYEINGSNLIQESSLTIKSVLLSKKFKSFPDLSSLFKNELFSNILMSTLSKSLTNILSVINVQDVQKLSKTCQDKPSSVNIENKSSNKDMNPSLIESIHPIIKDENNYLISKIVQIIRQDIQKLLKSCQDKPSSEAMGSPASDKIEHKYSAQSDTDEESEEEYAHVVEVSSFPIEFKTVDLINAFRQIDPCIQILWVDDHHALALFSSNVHSKQALSLQHPLFRCKPLSEAINKSKIKAQNCTEKIARFRPRPSTTIYVARRFIENHLGVKSSASPANRNMEKKRLNDAKEKKRLSEKLKEDLWND